MGIISSSGIERILPIFQAQELLPGIDYSSI